MGRHGLSFFLLLLACLVQAQTPPRELNILFDHYTIPGVIQSTATPSIFQAEFGLIWLGTSSGLFRFNGEDFQHYPYHSDKGLLLDQRQITVLHWDRQHDRLIIGTRMAGLLQFSYQSNVITDLNSNEETIHDIEETADGRIWISTPNGLFELMDNALVMIADVIKSKGPVPLLAQGDSLWVGSVQRVSLFLNGQRSHDINFESPGRTFPHTARSSAILIDNKKQLWVGTEKEGVMVYDIATGKLVKEFLPDDRPFYSRINAIHQDRTGLIWMLTKAEGLAVYNPKSDQLIYLQHDIYQDKALSGNNCYSILEDKTGLIWVGTNGAINFFDREQRKFDHYDHQRSNDNSLSDNMVRSVFEDDNLVWLGTDGGFINLIDRNENRIQRIPIKGKGLSDKESIVPFAFAKLNEQTILVGTSIGLLSFDKKSKTFSHFAPTISYLKDKRVRQLIIKGNTLYGIVVGLMFKFDLKTGQFKVYSLPQRNNVSVLYVDESDRFWVASNGAISLLNTSTDELSYFPLPRDTANYLVLNVATVRDKIWLATMNYGIYEISVIDEKLVIHSNLTNTTGLPDNTVYATIPDDFGNVWITTNRGLSKLDPHGRFTNYQVSEGVQAEEFNRQCDLKLKDGSIVLGGINGINIIDPLRSMTQSIPLLPTIYALKIRKGNHVNEAERSVLQDSLIHLASDETSFSIQFGLNDYRRPSRYQAEFILEGYDETWQKSAPFGSANYGQLSPGTYAFKVKLLNPAGEERIKSLLIYIKPPFWMTWWFRLILSVMVIAIAVISFRVRMKREKRDKDRLEELLKIRTKEIEESREQLANLNEKKDLIFSILSHDLRSPLTTLKGFLSLLIENGETFTKEEVKKHAELIRASVSNSLDLIDNTLFWSLSQMGGIQYSPTRISINEMVKKVSGLYQLALTRKGIEMVLKVEPNLHVKADENMLYVVLRNLVSNAIKFTPEGKKIKVEAYAEMDRVIVKVEDEGVGMSMDYINKLLTEAHPTIKKGTSNEKGTGLGLALCQQFISAQQGTMEINSLEGKGSTFTITLPLTE